MAYNFELFKQKAKQVEEWLGRELATIRTGRATPALLDGVMVESYGSRAPLKQVGAVGAEDSRSLKITLWDKGQVKAVESAIQLANLGVSVTVDGSALRVTFPELTGEKRTLLVKVTHDKVEEAKISLRKEREQVWNDIQAKERDGAVSEDDKFRYKTDLQKLVDEANKKLEDAGKRKESEITSF